MSERPVPKKSRFSFCLPSLPSFSDWFESLPDNLQIFLFVSAVLIAIFQSVTFFVNMGSDDCTIHNRWRYLVPLNPMGCRFAKWMKEDPDHVDPRK